MSSPCACGNPQRDWMVHTAQTCVAKAALPYPTGSGSTGSEASADREQHLDDSGTTSLNQGKTLEWLDRRGTWGGTQAELQDHLQVGHGTASQVLSTLHQAGKVERLTLRRLGSHIYVLPRFTVGRATSGYRRLQSRQVLRTRIADLEEALRLVLAHPGRVDAIASADLILNNRLEDE